MLAGFRFCAVGILRGLSSILRPAGRAGYQGNAKKAQNGKAQKAVKSNNYNISAGVPKKCGAARRFCNHF